MPQSSDYDVGARLAESPMTPNANSSDCHFVFLTLLKDVKLATELKTCTQIRIILKENLRKRISSDNPNIKSLQGRACL